MMRSPIINVMDRAARRAGRALARDFNEVQQLQVSKKGSGNFVKAAIRKAEGTLKYELSKARPTYGYYNSADLQENIDNNSHQWVVRALDGTSNYMHGQPHFSISIAHIEDKNLIESCVYDPLSEEFFWAIRNNGEFLNDTRLRVSNRQNLNECIIATEMPFMTNENHPHYLTALGAVIANTGCVRTAGAPELDLAYLAAGRYDGYWSFDVSAKDIMAGTLLVRESGGFLADQENKVLNESSDTIIASNGAIKDSLIECICSGESSSS